MMYDGTPIRVIILTCISCSLSLLALLLRFYARKKIKAKYGTDDWLAIVVLILLYAWFGVYLFCERNAFADNPTYNTPARLISFAKGSYILIILTPSPIFAAKFSIIFLYRRIFYHDRRFRIANTIVGVFSLFCFIAATLAVVFRCIPIKKNWTFGIDGKCVKLQYFMVGFEAPSVAVDFIMIALPIRVVRDLRLPLFDKIGLCITFFLGGFVGVFGLVRIGLLYKPDYLSVRLLGFLTGIQQFLALLCACLPTYRPLFPREIHLSRTFRDWSASLKDFISQGPRLSSASKTSSSENSALHNRKWPRYNQYDNLGNSSSNNPFAPPLVQIVSDVPVDRAGRDLLPLDVIAVKHEVHIV